MEETSPCLGASLGSGRLPCPLAAWTLSYYCRHFLFLSIKEIVEICFLSCRTSTYVLFSVLPFGSQSLKYVVTRPGQETPADPGSDFTGQAPTFWEG